jgi:hypothetical protein
VLDLEGLIMYREVWRLDGLAFPIVLEARHLSRDFRRREYRVTYGKQVRADLLYQRACLELGAAIMHALSCEGKLDLED